MRHMLELKKKKDPESADFASSDFPEFVPVIKRKRNLDLKKTLFWTFLFIIGLGAVFGLGVLASVCERSFHSKNDLVALESPGTQKDTQLDTRGDRHEEEDFLAAIQSPAPRVAEDAPMSAVSPIYSDNEGLMIPISTHTELSTIYSMSKIPKTTLYPITEASSSAVSQETSCIVSVVTTETQVALVTVTVVPTTSGTWSGYVTITGEASTVTEVNTATSYTSGLPDVTMSNNPSTLTQVQTDLSYTSGLPDATVSGNPSTITNVQTRVSVTSGLPDVTVSGNPSTITNVDATYSLTSSSAGPDNSRLIVVISDLWQSLTHSTVTSIVTRVSTATTTEPNQPYSTPVGSSSGIFYTSNVEGATGSDRHETISSTDSITATVYLTEPPYPSNSTAPSYPYGTVTSVVAPTTPVVVSGSNSILESWSRGASHMCAMVIIATVMFLF